MTELGRRPLLKGAGAALAGLGGLASPVAASGHVTPLTDVGADVLVYWSEIDEDAEDPDEPSDYGFPGPSDPLPPGGLTFGTHDPPGGGLFDFRRIVMRPDGNLTNTAFVLLGGALVVTEPARYSLNHLGRGLYQSVDQEMWFRARNRQRIKKILGLDALPPAVDRLARGRWYAVGNEFAQLGLDASGSPDPTKPLWAATRVDFYRGRGRKFELSLLYVIGADDTPNPADGIPQEAYNAAGRLIMGGRLEPSSA